MLLVWNIKYFVDAGPISARADGVVQLSRALPCHLHVICTKNQHPHGAGKDSNTSQDKNINVWVWRGTAGWKQLTNYLS